MRFLTLGSLMLTLPLVGCGTKQYRHVEPSGFLGDYSKMVEGKSNEALSVYVNPQADCRKYSKAIIEPVVFQEIPGYTTLASLKAEDQSMLLALGRETISSAMREGQFEIVDQPGPDVLRVKSAIIEADKANMVMALGLSVAPYLWEISTVWGVSAGKWPFLGELAGEMEISDAQTGERLFASVDKVVGTLFSTLNPINVWGDVRDGFEFWRIREGKRMKSCRATGSFHMPEDERGWMRKTFDYMAP
ncbi:MAG: DUF3313 domain-containing protein [Methylophilaceae bacterium]|nr:DUF3313 domain-containing protein [Methylophilaceae bacterium]